MTQTPLDRARRSLEGLSVGDAFGERFFERASLVRTWLERRMAPQLPWRWTDDTAMAVGIFEVLDRCEAVEADVLAEIFARRFVADPTRGYGAMSAAILAAIGRGGSWRDLSQAAFGGKGSMGNGAAMRVAPLGAYFADDPEQIVSQASASAAITHGHVEGRAGAIAVAVAAGFAWLRRARPDRESGYDMLRAVIVQTPANATRDGIECALELGFERPVDRAVEALGNGSQVTAPDTVPFVLWCAARHLDSYQDALWTTVSGLGDRDTTCAMVGGIVALSAGAGAIAESWLEAREPLPL